MCLNSDYVQNFRNSYENNLLIESPTENGRRITDSVNTSERFQN